MREMIEKGKEKKFYPFFFYQWTRFWGTGLLVNFCPGSLSTAGERESKNPALEVNYG
ncbi:MAG: hypothetical protein ABIK99_02250 [candidate division WOR-3 bacterium]